MLIFSTKLITNQKLTDTVFIQLIVDWLSNNSNYKFGKIDYDGRPKFSLSIGTDSLEIANYSDVVTVHLVSLSKGIIWTNDYVFRNKGQNSILAIQLYSDAADMSIKIPDRFNKPRVLKQIVQNGYGGMDGELPVSDTPYMITADNIDVAKKMIMHESVYFMPVVYVSYPRYAIDKPIDFEEMARNLSGIAHVVVEAKDVAEIVRRETGEKNPYAGAVDIFYGKQSSYRVIPDNYKSLAEMQQFIEKWVQQKILMTRIEDEYSWMKVQFTQLKSENREAPELLELYQQLLKEEESENEQKKQHIEDLEYRIMELEEKMKDLNASLLNKDSQLQTYAYRFEQSHSVNREVKFLFDEQELYEGEISDIILKILEKEKKLMDSDANLRVARKFHVLENLLGKNAQTGKAEEIAECLRGIIDKSCNLNNQKKRQLIESGFTVDVGTHYRVVFNGDERYGFTLSKTAGDYRSNTNTLKDAINTLFGR